MSRKTPKVIDPVVQRGFQALLDSDLIKALRKQHGAAIVNKASDVDDLVKRRISTGSFAFDYGLTGGLAVGRVTIFFGPKSSSKTTTGLRVLGNAQKMCSRCWDWYVHPITGEVGCPCGEYQETVCAFVNTEQHWNKSWASKVGVDTEFMLYSQPDYGEMAVDVTADLLASGHVHVLLLDSLAFLVPMSEADKSASDNLMGDQARLISRAMRRFLSAIGRCEREHGFRPTLIMTNQISMKLGVMFGNPETTPGGYKPGFLAATEARVWSGKHTGEDEVAGADEVEMKFRITKQKAGIPFKEGEYLLITRDRPELNKKSGDVYDEPFLLSKAADVGLVDKAGHTWLCEGREYPKKEALLHDLLFDRAFWWSLRNKTLNKLIQAETAGGY